MKKTGVISLSVLLVIFILPFSVFASDNPPDPPIPTVTLQVHCTDGNGNGVASDAFYGMAETSSSEVENVVAWGLNQTDFTRTQQLWPLFSVWPYNYWESIVDPIDGLDELWVTRTSFSVATHNYEFWWVYVNSAGQYGYQLAD